MNKSITIAAEYRGTNDICVATSVATGYAQNSSPIDGTDIFRSVPVIDRELRFLQNIDLSGLPSLISNNAESVVSYLRLTDSNRYYTTSILKILIEFRRTAHAERINNSENIVTIHPGDIIIAHTAIQRDKIKNKIDRSRLLKVHVVVVELFES